MRRCTRCHRPNVQTQRGPAVCEQCRIDGRNATRRARSEKERIASGKAPGAIEMSVERLLWAARELDEALAAATDIHGRRRAATALMHFQSKARDVRHTMTSELVKVTGEGLR